MSSSKGNVLTITDLLKVYDKNIIWWFYARFDNMHAFDIALDNDVIRYYSEFDRGAHDRGYFSHKKFFVIVLMIVLMGIFLISGIALKFVSMGAIL